MTIRMLKIGALGLFALVMVFVLRSPTASAVSFNTNDTGAELFKTNCARCHGENGEGKKGPNLTTEKKKAKWKDSDEKLLKKIRNGGVFMPSFKDKLTEGEIKAIADHVRQLAPNAN